MILLSKTYHISNLKNYTDIIVQLSGLQFSCNKTTLTIGSFCKGCIFRLGSYFLVDEL